FCSGVNFRLLCRQDKFALELSAILLDVVCFLNGSPHGFCCYNAVRAGSPGFCISDERKWTRRNGLKRKPFVRPASAERPLLEVHVAELPLFHLSRGPVRGRRDVRRIGQSRSVH